MKGSRICYPEICHFGVLLFQTGVLIISNCRHLKNSKYRERLSPNSPYLPKDSPSKGTQLFKSPPWEFHQPRKIDSYHRREEERKNWHDTPKKLCYKLSYLSSALLRAHSSFLKISYSPLKGLHHLPFSLLRWYLSLNSKPTWGVIHFFPGCLLCYMRYTC